MNKKVSKFDKWEQEVRETYPRREYQGVFESVMHADMTLTYMRSAQGKKVLVDEMGELPYEENLRKQENALKLRRAELSVLRETLK